MKLFFHLLKHRMHWYRHTLFNELVQTKHVLFLMLAVSGLSLSDWAHAVSMPILTLIQGTTSSFYYLATLLTIQSIYLGIVVVQKKALKPLAYAYLQSLPIYPKQHRIINLIMLLVANNLLWLPILISLSTHHHWKETLQLLTLSLAILSIQAQYLENGRVNAVIMMMGLNSLAYFSVFTQSPSLLYLNFGCTLSSLFMFRNQSILLPKPKVSFLQPIHLFQLIPFIGLQLAICKRQYFMKFLLRVISSVALLLLGFEVITQGNPDNSFSIITLVVCFVMMIWSSFYPLMKQSRESYAPYLLSLPMNNTIWLTMDYLFVTSVASLFSLCFIVLLKSHQKITLSSALYLVLSSLLLSVLLLPIRNFFSKQGAWISFLTVCFFSLVIILRSPM